MNFINTKKAFKKLYMFYLETFRIILNPSSVKKLKQHLAMSAIKTIRLFDPRNDSAVTQKTSNANQDSLPRQNR